MRFASSVIGLLLACVGLACGGGGANPASPPASPGGPNGCEIGPSGPLIGYTYTLAPQPPAQGGPIADGIYDLVQVVVHGKASGPASSDNAPAMRMAMKLTTEDRGAGQQGRVVMTVNLPPVFECAVGRFAGVGTQLRTTRVKSNKTDSSGYRTNGDTLELFPEHDVTYILRRRP